MIQITYDECSEKITFKIDPSSDKGISFTDMVLSMTVIAHEIAKFVKNETNGVISVDRFMNAICSLENLELQDMTVKKTNNEG